MSNGITFLLVKKGQAKVFRCWKHKGSRYTPTQIQIAPNKNKTYFVFWLFCCCATKVDMLTETLSRIRRHGEVERVRLGSLSTFCAFNFFLLVLSFGLVLLFSAFLLLHRHCMLYFFLQNRIKQNRKISFVKFGRPVFYFTLLLTENCLCANQFIICCSGKHLSKSIYTSEAKTDSIFRYFSLY